MERKRFFIVDGFAQIFRAFYGVRGIDNNAVYGFTTMLKKLIDTEKPDYLAVAFDRPEATFRKELFPEYKANRDAMPESLIPQIPLIRELLNCLNIPIVEKPGFEADDIMGTLAVKAAKENFQAVIVSGDKDLLQLVKSDDIVIYDSKKDVYFLNESQIPEFFGCRSEQIIDLLSIWGDSADNIPGVPGVGEKGAKKLLETYGSLDAIYQNLKAIKRKSYREGFEKARDHIELTKKLVTIRTDLDIEFDQERCAACEPNNAKLIEFYDRLNFKSLLKQVPIETKKISIEYECIDNVELLRNWIEIIREAGFFVFDTETTSLDPIAAELVGVALATQAGKAGYVPLGHQDQTEQWRQQAENLLRPLFADEHIVKCAHNAKYDLSVLTARGWDLRGTFEDTMLMAYLTNPNDNRYSLDFLAESLFHYQTIHFEDLCGSGKDQKTFSEVPLKDAAQYAAEDADICFQLYDHFLPELKEQGLVRVYEDIERPLVPVLTRMELAGVHVDCGYLRLMSEAMGARIEQLEKEIYELAGEEFNIKSTKQLGQILFEKMGIAPVKKTGKTKSYSTDQSVLEKLAAKDIPIAIKLQEYRLYSKLKSTYVDALPKLANPKTGRIHSSFNQFVTATGRLSSNHPNLQNIPIRSELGREIRAAFVPREGWRFIGADYSQIELRLMAHFSEDETLIAGFRNGEDIHLRTAGEILGVLPDLITDEMRSMAKSINFGLIYGMGEFRLAQEIKVSRKTAREYIDAYFEKMPKVLSFRDAVIQKAREDGEVRTFYGRKRALPELRSRNRNLQQQGERLAVNTLIQGSAAEIIKLAMIRLDGQLASRGLQAQMLLQVHDELVLECPPEELEQVRDLLTRTMEQVVEFRVPLSAQAKDGIN